MPRLSTLSLGLGRHKDGRERPHLQSSMCGASVEAASTYTRHIWGLRVCKSLVKAAAPGK